MKQRILEVCVDSVQSAIYAKEGGADRIELCSNLIIGGTSPTPALFKQIKAYTDLRSHVLLRPRFGDFCYDKYEYEVLKEEVEMFRDLGAEGIVIGILNPNGTLNLEQMGELIQIAGDMHIALHRAFDVSVDPFDTMEQAIALGVHTILTSGQKASAYEGRETLSQLVERAGDRIDIMPGSGIDAGSIEKLLPIVKATSYHLSGKITKESAMTYKKSGVPMGLPGFDEFQINETSVENVRKAAKVLKG